MARSKADEGRREGRGEGYMKERLTSFDHYPFEGDMADHIEIFGSLHGTSIDTDIQSHRDLM